MTIGAEIGKGLDRVRALGVLGAVAGGALLLWGARSSVQGALESYLFAYIFWLNFTLGCLGLLMLHHMVSGGWGFMIQRVIEAGMRTLPVMALLFVPVLLGVEILYPWASPASGAGDQLWRGYLNVPFFTARALLYFVLWIVMATCLGSWSRHQDVTGDPRITRRLRLLSAPGLAVYVLTLTFASVYW
ncbi:MAG TPA: hypothetical protein VMF59_09440, partial [Bacteroidota bacterium]|nr:hypothetical protein [Bacteroidota bacterium]